MTLTIPIWLVVLGKIALVGAGLFVGAVVLSLAFLGLQFIYAFRDWHW